MSDEMRWGEPFGNPGEGDTEPHERTEEAADTPEMSGTWDSTEEKETAEIKEMTAESREMEELKGADIPWLDQIPGMNRKNRQNQEAQINRPSFSREETPRPEQASGQEQEPQPSRKPQMSQEPRQEQEPGHERESGQVPPKYAHYEMHQGRQSRDIPLPPTPKKTKGSFLNKLLVTGVLAVVFGLIAGLVFQGINLMTGKHLGTISQTPVGTTEIVPTQDSDGQDASGESDMKNLVAQNGTVAGVSQAAMPAVVAITSVSIQEIPSFFSYYGFGYGTREYPSTGSGSGIIVGENDDELLIATNNHVVSGATTLSVCFIGSDVVGAEEETQSLASGDGDINVENAVNAKIKGTDEENDLAVVAVLKSDIPDETMKEIKIAQLGNSDDLVVGEQVVAIGNALGYGQSVTSGWISALNRTIMMEDGSSSELIQTDAAINPGNSGGALLNMRGELIGINSAKYADNAVEGMGYAIPISKAQPILEELMSRRTREKVAENKASYLGVNLLNLSKEAIEMYNMPAGAFVAEVNAGTAAESAGIHKGDIIIKLDGQKVSSREELIEMLTYYEASEEVEVVVSRANNGEYVEQSIQVVLGAREES